MKRKAESEPSGNNGKGVLKKRSKTILSDEDVQKSFRKGLFDKETLKKSTNSYAESEPYKHTVINSLINDDLLRSVRNEIKENVEFTPKETDIYKIHQSGDLANLDGLDDGALEKLPSLLRLRDAMYSSSFRKYVASITGSGELSGRKTDMAINVYTPGCYLLCHDDVIGSRRISYILYLTDPDMPWKEEWGGALRLYPTKTFEDGGEKTITPSPDFTKVIPPAWNQLSFFAVQPGESFHDVEEVYHAANKEQLEKEGGRIRMAISGWYHIPQIGEEGYIKGAEEKWGANSSLMQLQGNPDRYDFPQSQTITVEAPKADSEDKDLDEDDLTFLLKYMAPTYLTPDTLEQVTERFLALSSVELDSLLSNKFSARVREYVEAQEAAPLPSDSAEIEKGSWKVAKPPHKHRFLFLQPKDRETDESAELNPIEELLEVFLPSRQFRKWLEIATQCEIENYDVLARRFRKSYDYALATSHEGQPRLEISLGLTPTPGWGVEEDEEEEEGDSDEEAEGSKANSNGKSKADGKKNEPEVTEKEEIEDVGGQEVYMAGDDDEADGDAAIYKSSSDPDDDNLLFTMPASWNKMSIVLRDSGVSIPIFYMREFQLLFENLETLKTATDPFNVPQSSHTNSAQVLKFVKYVSKNAKGDRWDISGAFGVKELDDDDDDDDDNDGEEASGEIITLEDSEEEPFNGFPDSEDSDSN
ncbi:Prolyl 3,4-dihydroxylase [Lachnellula hyalina]|uniref:uS12 prolyl 3,4-dihydroxylase n=1 Tax=Lachnellula hyalina TaxID=1316788 RepID=A0A8H8QU72_9HELO|nr:Prolyl 3,4-dihydroxylase [Lachnellula hyalina]TVY22728.1 Prolyl 3,4-dihydroxylase [Lachnellula hyalina]